MGWPGPFIAMAMVLATSCVAPRAASATELIVVEHERCAVCIRFDATVGRTYNRTPQGHAAPLHRINIARRMPADLVGIRVVPTFILREKGREVGRFSGYFDSVTFYRQVDALLAAAK